MGRVEYTEDDKTRIIEEYQAAVAAGEGGGLIVAQKYGLHPSNIIGWSKAKARAKDGNGHAKKRRRRTAPADTNLGAPTAKGDALVSSFERSIDSLIAFHERKAKHLRQLREGYSAPMLPAPAWATHK